MASKVQSQSLVSGFALIVGSNRYDSYAPLDQAEADAQRMAELFRDPTRGALDEQNIVVLRSPRSGEVKEALIKAASNAAKDQSPLFLYFAGHGLPGGKDGVRIVFRDTDPGNLFTSLSLRDTASVLGQHAPSASITILDLCHSGNHLSGAAELALEELWKDESTLADGHFILAACGPRQTAGEVLGGGRFTSLLLDQLEKIGQERPYVREIGVEPLANAVIAAAQLEPIQRPTWTGIAVSKPIRFSLNPYWDAGASRPPVALSLDSIPDSERPELSKLVRAYVSPMTHVGTGRAWAAGASSALFDVVTSATSPGSKRIILGRLVQAIADRVRSIGGPVDVRELIETSSAATVALGQSQALYGEEIRALAFNLTEVADQVLQSLRDWNVGRRWLATEDGPAQIALAPLRFWNTLGEAALVALACALLGRRKYESDIVRTLVEIVKAKPHLQRTTWIGQYPDIATVLGYVASVDTGAAHDAAERFFNHYRDSAVAGRFPARATISPKEFGREMATQYAAQTPASRIMDRSADEGLALFFLMLAKTGESQIALTSRAASLIDIDGPGDYFLYVPKSVDAQFQRTMTNCIVYDWHRKSAEATAAMVAKLNDLAMKPLVTNSSDLLIDCLATYAAGRVYRNRCCFSVFSALAMRPLTPATYSGVAHTPKTHTPNRKRAARKDLTAR